MQTWSSAWGEQPIEHANEVTLSRKGATSRTRVGGPRSTRTKARTPVDRLSPANADLKKKLAEAREQQAATAEMLRVISTSPGDLAPVFEVMLANAVRLCGARFGMLALREGDTFRGVATHGVPMAYAKWLRRQPVIDLRHHPHIPLARIARSKKVLHIPDLMAEQSYIERDPRIVESARVRTILGVPMLKEDEFIGGIFIYRSQVQPFTDNQIALVTNFAAQAVIAIENTRLLNELRHRTNDLSESLEQQTATSEVLRVISSSPGDLEPVFRSMLENATRLCEAKFGNMYLWEGDAFRLVAAHNTPPALVKDRKRAPFRPGPNTAVGRMARTKQVVHVTDIAAEQAYFERDPLAVTAVELGRVRSALSVPMLKKGALIGAIAIYRQEVRPFTDKQIELVTNFAAQAVIAIENTRLLNELRESLQEQTATSEVLSVISRSPGELQPVFNTMLENALRICEAKFGVLFSINDEGTLPVAMLNLPPVFDEYLRQRERRKPRPDSDLDNLCKSRQVIHTLDMLQTSNTSPPAKLGGARTQLAVPMLKDEGLLGAIVIYRQEVRPFTDKQIELLKNFASQAVIAIENTRLLNELRQRTEDLSEALEQQTATSKVLQVISSSPGELEPVFEAMLANATRICEAKFGNLFLREGDAFRLVAMHGAPPAFAEARQRDSVIRPRPGTVWAASR